MKMQDAQQKDTQAGRTGDLSSLAEPRDECISQSEVI
jgi:hypothetical protein